MYLGCVLVSQGKLAEAELLCGITCKLSSDSILPGGVHEISLFAGQVVLQRLRMLFLTMLWLLRRMFLLMAPTYLCLLSSNRSNRPYKETQQSYERRILHDLLRAEEIILAKCVNQSGGNNIT